MPSDAPKSCPHCSSHEEKPAPTASLKSQTTYICPMCAGVGSDKPGSCPQCGMALEKNPLAKRNEPECCGDGGDDEVKDLWWRVRWSAAMTIPVVLLSMGMDLPVIRSIPHDASAWMQFVWATPVVFWVGWPLLARFLKSLRTLRFNMFTLIGLGVLAAWLYSTLALFAPGTLPHQAGHGGMAYYFESAAVITVLVLVGQLLELRARKATGSAIRALMNLTPKTALVVRDGSEVETPVEEIQVGDVIRIKPGTRIPVDGVVMEGSSSVDESMLTGESMPQTKETKSAVTGGTVNGNGTFLMRAERVGADTMLSQIVEMTAKAQASRAPVQRIADRVAAWFVPAVVGVAVLTFLLWWKFGPEPSLGFAVVNAVAVLIIACPCALGLATPMAVTVGLGRGAQLGVLIKNAETLERLQQIDIVMLDKTGTLTEGRPSVIEVVPLPGLSARDLLACAAAIEALSEHPIATAIVNAAKERDIPLATVTDFQAITGGGVLGNIGENEVFVGQASFLKKNGVLLDAECLSRSSQLQAAGCTVVVVVLNEKPLGLIAIKDKIKETTPQAIASLHALGLKLQMITGDALATAQRVAQDLGIDEVAAEVSPKEKLLHVYQARGKDRHVAFAGDGINDAPALAAADVGIAMGTGTDVAIQSASITLVKGDLRSLRQAFALSRETMKIIRQNLWFAFLYNGLGIPLAAGLLYPMTGWLLNPMIASAAMSLSSVSVILNSLRLRRYE
ncbi:MAG: heavy metal translocating P-type ATPase [Prosthecobacter sp.]|jgi:Cu+-exporting ATPase|uniref:copper-transporting P-type ATPase n=1 Tax=Prosthecobacter sp. TaxID=1965333 RepID=UPI0019E8DE8A|nr:copper-translocating P-type ATPase [Prosthecobacter sp.]MBE2285509.1 heavy metal translocating P-type ATPase [Prosthecobacter sp.]